MRGIYISRFTSWAPEFKTLSKWEEWANGKTEIPKSYKAPELEFTPPVFKRRLSQISKMTIQVIHDILPVDNNCKIVFVSARGEIAQQLKINIMLIEESIVMPATFSLSVFNAPVALASIALNITSGYTTVYFAENKFYDGFLTGISPVLCGSNKEIIFVYADELIPDEYKTIHNTNNSPFAFAAIVTAEKNNNSIFLPVQSEYKNNNTAEWGKSPELFLRYLFLNKKEHWN
jgi:hypothetical protein